VTSLAPIRAAQQEDSLSELESSFRTRKTVGSHASVWPTHGWVTSGFGFRMNPFTGLTQMHEGLDISNQWVPDYRPGRWYRGGCWNDLGHGRIVVISTGWHDHAIQPSEQGAGEDRQKVKRGDKIAEVGMSGKTRDHTSITRCG